MGDQQAVAEGWPVPTGDEVTVARHVVREAPREDTDHPVADRLAGCCSQAGNHAGATLAELRPVTTNAITAADVHALALLYAGPRATRS